MPPRTLRPTVVIAGFSILLTAAAGPLAAQSWLGGAAVGVQVRGAGGALAGARVEVLYRGPAGESGGPVPRATDAQGQASFGGLAEGLWSLEVSHPDHLSYVASLSLRRGRKPEVVTSFLEASGAGRNPMRVRLFQPGARQLGEPLAVAPDPPPAPGGPATVPEAAPAEGTPPPPPAPEPPPPAAEAEAPAAEEAPSPPPAEPVPPLAREAAPPAETQPPPAARARPQAPLDTVPPPAAETPRAPEPEPAADAEPEAAPAVEPAPPPEPSAATEPPARPTPSAVPETPDAPLGAPGADAAAKSGPEPAAEPAPAPPARESGAERPAGAPLPGPPPAPPAPEAPIPPPAPTVAPEPAPPPGEPPTAEPAPEPAPEPELPPLAASDASARSFGDRTCFECKPGEWAVGASREVAAGAGCPDDAVGRAEAGARRLADAAGEALSGYGGDALSAAVLARLDGAARAALQEELGPLLAPASPCRILAIAFPAGSRLVGFRFEALEDGEGGVCFGDEPCPIGDGRWLAAPGIERSAGATLLWAVFENRSGARRRLARFVGYFTPPAGWRR